MQGFRHDSKSWHNNDNNDDDNNNNNNNNNCIQRSNSRFFTISSLRREPSPTHTLKWPGHNRVQITWNTLNAYHVQHVLLHSAWYKVTAQLLSWTELKSHLFELYFIGWNINRWRRGGNRSTRRKPLATSFVNDWSIRVMIIVFTSTGVCQDFLQSSHCTANCLQHARSSSSSSAFPAILDFQSGE